MSFPKDFIWGAATAAYQIEGGANTDGRGRSVWDDFCDTPGKVSNGHSGLVACDHYHRFEEDIGIMQGIGLQAYRLSISWPRVMAEGTGAVNEDGLAFYDRLIDGLLAANIQPWVTLFHWDFPSTLFKRGGWLERDSASWFSEYASIVANRLGDRVHNWITLNEPQVYIDLGHKTGIHAPGLTLNLHDQLLAGHNTLRAHGMAVEAIRAASPEHSLVGWAPVGRACCPIDDKPETIEAARIAHTTVERNHHFSNSWWFDPALLGAYPEQGLEVFGADMPSFPDRDLKTIHQPLDFIGLNIYQGQMIKASAEGQPEVVPFDVGHPITAFDWPLVPEALNWCPRFIHERYDIPIYITENGLASMDWISQDGRVHDQNRIDFTARYLQQLHAGIESGADVRGYFHWSAFDNFEWAEGFTKRFGLVHIDYPTGTRTPKDSAHWYSDVISSNGESINA